MSRIHARLLHSEQRSTVVPKVRVMIGTSTQSGSSSASVATSYLQRVGKVWGGGDMSASSGCKPGQDRHGSVHVDVASRADRGVVVHKHLQDLALLDVGNDELHGVAQLTGCTDGRLELLFGSRALGKAHVHLVRPRKTVAEVKTGTGSRRSGTWGGRTIARSLSKVCVAQQCLRTRRGS